jgi:hypothetical protein
MDNASSVQQASVRNDRKVDHTQKVNTPGSTEFYTNADIGSNVTSAIGLFGVNSQTTRAGRGYGADEEYEDFATRSKRKEEMKKISPRDVARQMLKHCNVVRKKNFNVSPRFKEINEVVYQNNRSHLRGSTSP